MNSREVVARFEAERQALALMDHPNIARILDGGTTDSGLPFFAMDLVRGMPITDIVSSGRLLAAGRVPEPIGLSAIRTISSLPVVTAGTVIIIAVTAG
jgi:serine/threonine protein kinase